MDFTQPEGQQILRDLAVKSDVVLENFKVGGLSAYGLDYASLSALNPELIYCSITGFGQSGPYAQRAGYDFLIQGLGGLMSLTGHPDDDEGGGPVKTGVALVDILTGLYATVAVLAALNHRTQTGEGQHIDMALLDVEVACLANQAMNYLVSGESPTRLGNAHPNIVPYQAFPTADGDMILTIGNDAQFRRFCEVADRLDWVNDPRFATNQARVVHRMELVPLIRQVTVFRRTEEWIALLEAVGVPCGPINSVAQVFADKQLAARSLAFTMTHPLGQTVPQVVSPIRLSRTPVEYRRPPPLLGEHTEQVLRYLLGHGDARVNAWRQAGIVG